MGEEGGGRGRRPLALARRGWGRRVWGRGGIPGRAWAADLPQARQSAPEIARTICVGVNIRSQYPNSGPPAQTAGPLLHGPPCPLPPYPLTPTVGSSLVMLDCSRLRKLFGYCFVTIVAERDNTDMASRSSYIEKNNVSSFRLPFFIPSNPNYWFLHAVVPT